VELFSEEKRKNVELQSLLK
jgi:hypothetical protein